MKHVGAGGVAVSRFLEIFSAQPLTPLFQEARGRSGIKFQRNNILPIDYSILQMSSLLSCQQNPDAL